MTTQLQLRRQGAGMSQSELARKAEISVRTLQSLETSARNIDKVAVITAIKLARALDCNIEDILDCSE
jgi:DNA-binding XRE family transcriptional regulator